MSVVYLAKERFEEMTKRVCMFMCMGMYTCVFSGIEVV